MAGENDVTLSINVDAKKASSSIEAFGKDATKALDGAEKSVGNLSNAFKSIGGAIAAAVAGIAVAFKAIGEANEAERGVNQLSVAIAATGEFSREAVQGLQAYAEELSNLTGIDDDVIVSSLALAKSFGITNEQSKNLVTAATNLSAVTGVDLDTAIKQLGGTFDGTLGKLANLGPEFRNLTKQQIENGAAVDLINQKYGEAGKALGDSFEGSLNKLKNSFNDAFKAIGQEIIGDPQIKQALNDLTKAMLAVAPIAAQVSKLVIEAFKIMATGAATVVFGFTGALAQLAGAVGASGLQKSLEGVSNSALTALDNLTKTADASTQTAGAVNGLDETLTKLSKSVKKSSKDSGKAVEDLKKQYEELFKSIQNAGLNEVQIAGRTAGERLNIVERSLQKGIISEQQASEDKGKILAEFNKINEKYQDERTQADEEGAIRRRNLLEAEKKNLEDFNKATEFAINSATTAVRGGDEKQRFQGIGTVISGALSAFLGPLGGAIGGFITQISQLNKDEAKNFIKDFVNSAPDFVKKIAENLPELVAGLAEALTKPEFWVRAAEAWFLGLRSLYINLYAGIFNSVRDVLVNAFGGVFRAFSDKISSLFKPLIDAMNALKDAVGKAGSLGGKGGGRGVVAEGAERVGRALGLAKGGVVYAASGAFVPRGTDTVPAMLTPGELVVPTDIVGQLASFLAGQSGQGAISTDTAILTAILQALQQPMVVQAEAKVNQSAFADIILQLNRQNARMSA